MLLRAVLVCVAGGLASCSSGKVDSTGPDVVRTRMSSCARPSVLFIGNSYTFGLPREFAREAARHGHTVDVREVAHNGWSLSRHAADPGTLAALGSRNWDVVVLQEYSRCPSRPWCARWNMAPALRFLAAEARKRGAQPVLYQTWGRRNGDPDVAGDDFFSMNQRVRAGCALAAAKAGGIPIVPIGDLWEEEFRAGRGNALYAADGSHPSPRGVGLNARGFFRYFYQDGPCGRR